VVERIVLARRFYDHPARRVCPARACRQSRRPRALRRRTHLALAVLDPGGAALRAARGGRGRPGRVDSNPNFGRSEFLPELSGLAIRQRTQVNHHQNMEQPAKREIPGVPTEATHRLLIHVITRGIYTGLVCIATA